MLIFIITAIGFLISLVYCYICDKRISIFNIVLGSLTGLAVGLLLTLCLAIFFTNFSFTEIELQKSNELISLTESDNYYLNYYYDEQENPSFQYLCKNGYQKNECKNSKIKYIDNNIPPYVETYKKTYNNDLLDFLIGYSETVTIFYIPKNSIKTDFSFIIVD